MKKIMFMFLLMIFLPSCVVQKIHKPVSLYVEWNGEKLYFVSKVPVIALWCKANKNIPENWQEHKRFCSVEELRLIIEEIGHNARHINYKINKPEKLLIDFRDGTKIIVPFYLDDEKKEFVGPRGRSKKLWKLFREKEVSLPYRRKPPSFSNMF